MFDIIPVPKPPFAAETGRIAKIGAAGFPGFWVDNIRLRIDGPRAEQRVTTNAYVFAVGKSASTFQRFILASVVSSTFK